MILLLPAYIFKVSLGWALSYTKLNSINKNLIVFILNIILNTLFTYLVWGYWWENIGRVIFTSFLCSFLWFLYEISKKKKTKFHKFFIHTATRWVLGIICFIIFFVTLSNSKNFHDVLSIKPLVPAILLLILIVRKRKNHIQ